MARRKTKASERQEAVDHVESAKPTVVGIGASAGGLSALKRLLALIPADSGLVFVVVVHLSPEHKSHLADLLQPSIKFPVRQVVDTVALEPNNVYVIPPNANLSAIDTHLRLSKLEESRRERAPIDHFFRTLASTHDGHSIGLILTGTGSDGTLGLKEIKAKGGVILVQDPNEAEFDGMPQSAIATGLVDRILPLAEIPDVLMRLARAERHLSVTVDKEDPTAPERVLLPKILAVLKARTERDFSRYKAATLLRRIARRMQLHYIDDFDQYLEKLREQPEEARALGDDLLITVTSFFRDPDVFKKLEMEIIPHLFEGKGPENTVRVWSVGCATGEEAYSLAMLLLEEASRRDISPKVQIFASDLHKRSLDSAREGVYPGDIQTDVTPERLKRFFQQENGGYRICKEVRDMVVFAPHNLLGDPPFSRLDMVACRNLLIYLDRSVQRDVIDLFHYALCPNGYLLLGSAETVDASELFRTEDKKLCLYRKRNVPAPEPRLPVFPLVRSRISSEVSPKADYAITSIPYQTVHQNLLERFAPPSILVSPDNKLVHLSEDAGKYLVLPGGETTLSVLRLVREELRIELQGLLQSARGAEEMLDSRPIPVRFNGHAAPVVMHVRPAQDKDLDGFVLVIFEEHAPQTEENSRRGASSGKTKDLGQAAKRIAELEMELSTSRQRLQATIEEYETSREEMKASQEEMQSTNEELRSTMEELETSKEELQSINEELQTVNQENRHKVEELSQLSSDIQNLLTSTEIATLFLDRELRIMRYTPRLADLFNIRVADRGRPILDLTHRLGYQTLREDAQMVLERLVPIEREIQDEAKRWYLTRVLPYRSAEDRIEGVVITFVEITDRKRAEEALRESEQLRRVALAGGRMGTWRWDLDAQLIWGDPQFWTIWGATPSDDPRPLSFFNERMSPRSVAEVGAVVTTAIEKGEEFDGPLEIIAGPKSGHWFQWRGRAGAENKSVLSGVTFDITEQKHAEARAREHEEQQAFLLKLNDAVRPLTEAEQIRLTACRLLGEHLGASRAYYVDFDPERNTGIVSEDYRVPGLRSLAGTYPFEAFRSTYERIGTGEAWIVPDVEKAVEIQAKEREFYVAQQVIAWANIPLAKAGRLEASLCVVQTTARRWTEQEIALIEDVADRTWAAVERARAEAALRRSEDRFRSMADAVPVLIWETDESGAVSVNGHYLQFFAVTFDEICGMGWARFLHPDDAAGYIAAYREAFVQRKAYSYECRFRRSDGQYRWLRTAGGPFGVDRFVGASLDVTDIRDAQRQLKESEENQRKLLEGMPQLVWRSGNDGIWTWSSPQWQTFTGQSLEQSRGQGWLDALHPDDVHLALEAWAGANDAGKLEAELRIREAWSGQYRYHQTRAVPIREDGDAIVEWLGTCTDIEDLKQAEAARQLIEEQFRLFVDNVQEYGLVQTDAGGIITNWNPGAERLFGFTPTEVVGKDFSVLLTSEDREKRVFANELAYVSEGHRNEDARWFVRKDGSKFWVRWITEPIRNEGGTFIGLAKIMRDETERERSAEFIKNALAEKEELLKEIHHRVKNNLQVITSLLNLQADQIEDGQTLAAFDEARNRVASIASIHELLYRSSSVAAIDLADYAREFAPSLISFYGIEHRVTFEIAGTGAKLELERAVPYGLLLNELLSNALKHAFPREHHGKINVSFENEGESVLLRFRDDGVGLPSGFDVDKTSSLGLKLVHRLARQLRGTVRFLSSESGTSVEIEFPNATS